MKKWLLESGLIVIEPEDPNYGGIHSFYDSDKKRFGFLYPEITGYGLSLFRFLYSIESDERYLKLAQASAEWLASIYDKFGGIVQGIEGDKTQSRLVYSFDSAICAKGLLDHYLLCEDKDSLALAKKILEWIATEALESDGTLKPLYEIDSKRFIEDKNLWYKQKGCLHVKTAIPFLQLYEMVKDESFLEKGMLIYNSYKNYQNRDGSISLYSNRESKLVNLHTQCYALEGMLYAFKSSGQKYLLDDIQRALEWSCKNILEDGSLPLWYNSKYESKASYAAAQLLRLLVIFSKVRGDKQFNEYQKKISSFLVTMQEKNSGRETMGGLYEEYYKRPLFGWTKRNRINSWGSMFAIQALYWLGNKENLAFESAIEYLF